MADVTTIVHVDDQPIFKQGLRALLDKFAEFTLVASGRNLHDAIALVQSHRPDMLIMDTNIPGNGIEAAKIIVRSHPITKIIFISNSERPEHTIAALASGALGYIPKGATEDELLACLRSVRDGNKYVASNPLDKMKSDAPDVQIVEDDFFTPVFTGRELEVVRMLKEGLMNREIAQRLAITETTVKHHVSVIMQKLRVRNRVEATRAILKYLPER